MKMTKAWSIRLALLIASACVTWAVGDSSYAQATAPRAVVQAVQGEASVTPGADREPENLAQGSVVNAWNMISTEGQSKLFLQWETGILNLLGEFSSIFLTSRQTEAGPIEAIEVAEGVLRVIKQSGGGSVSPYVVTTPAAVIEPASYDDPVDFVVEAYMPTSSVITVISGQV
ncbi:MAG TPA: hypothetical protein VK463_07940, partial [Desulfomonilaceae bacterium]|nr:hypothetical protein [Desulfomonilaceae bacterium]